MADLTKSQRATYTQSIGFLEQARQSLRQRQEVIRSHRETLASHYQGSDGVAYGQVVQTWLEEVDRIANTCVAMENTLGESMQRSSHVQEANYQAVVSNNGSLTGFGQGIASTGGSIAGNTFNTLSPGA
ncbi:MULTISPECIES: hypothetical protein [unclassified Streptomyces]|uniref:hypothetical protein n=1 Tax=unclassified Streptomyces TaxID=2593676 RepID=UPI000378A6F3|nr:MULTISPECIES: hypothetical protein [unclassified Streptomyces]EYT81999.1 hypothetical protein CF54_15955 [Streptomyces sp. Tu 6176]